MRVNTAISAVIRKRARVKWRIRRVDINGPRSHRSSSNSSPPRNCEMQIEGLSGVIHLLSWSHLINRLINSLISIKMFRGTFYVIISLYLAK